MPPDRPSRLRNASTAVGLISAAAAWALLLFVAGYLVGHADGRGNGGPLVQRGLLPAAAPPALPPPPGQEFDIVWDALARLERSYFGRENLDRGKLAQGAVQGMIGAVGDPYTRYLTPDERDLADLDLNGTTEGIGVSLDPAAGPARVAAVMEGSPAQRADLRIGDVIEGIDGEPVGASSLAEVARRIRGKVGSTVSLNIRRPGLGELLEVSLERALITRQSVSSRFIADGEIGYIRVDVFAEPTPRQLRSQLQEMVTRQPRGLVLDLRGNRGGRLAAAVDVTSQFLADGVVLYQDKGGENGRRSYSTNGMTVAPSIPLVVLVDRGSASAAEIVAAALRDNRRAILVGETTFGKGTVQEVQDLADRSQLRITTAEWLTPSGLSVNGTGVVPDVEVMTTAGSAGDLALDVARAQLADRTLASRE